MPSRYANLPLWSRVCRPGLDIVGDTLINISYVAGRKLGRRQIY